jgi:hypothetical protein
MLTGTLPHKHGVHTHNFDFSTIDTEETFLGPLEDYETIGVSANEFAIVDVRNNCLLLGEKVG